MPTRWLPQWVTDYRDRHKKVRYRFRRTGYPTYSFKHQPGTEGFREEYAACLSREATGPRAIGADRIIPGSFDELLGHYYQHADFLTLAYRSQETYRGIFERWRERKTKSGRRYGSALVRDLTTQHAETMVAELLPQKAAANTLRKRLMALMDFAVRRGDAPFNPLKSVKSVKNKTQGFHTWTEEEIAIYQATHPLGTPARLAFDLMLWTGQRISDTRMLGPQNIQGSRLQIAQKKGQGMVRVSLPILPPLAESLLATPTRDLAFLLSARGEVYSEKGFSNRLAKWIAAAGIPHCSPHGLRKAAARRFAEAGCSNPQIKAWTGHTTDSMVGLYTRAASQVQMSDDAAELLMANLRKKFAGQKRAIEA